MMEETDEHEWMNTQSISGECVVEEGESRMRIEGKGVQQAQLMQTIVQLQQNQ